MTNSLSKTWLLTGLLTCMLSVIFGAFAAHGLKGRYDEYALSIFETGARYQMYHGIMILIFVCLKTFGALRTNLTHWLLLIGVILFSGSLYLITLTGISKFGMVTPIGGVCFILAYTIALIEVYKSKASAPSSNR